MFDSRWWVVHGLAVPPLWGALLNGALAFHEPAGRISRSSVILAECTHAQGHAVTIEFNLDKRFVRVMGGPKLAVSTSSQTAAGGLNLHAQADYITNYPHQSTIPLPCVSGTFRVPLTKSRASGLPGSSCLYFRSPLSPSRPPEAMMTDQVEPKSKRRFASPRSWRDVDPAHDAAQHANLASVGSKRSARPYCAIMPHKTRQMDQRASAQRVRSGSVVLLRRVHDRLQDYT